MIEIRGVTRAFGRKTAVDGLDLVVPVGELFAFLGPNGAGKTTTIKMMVGLLRPSAGTIQLSGYDVVREQRDASRVLGYIPDEPYLYDKLTGREFLEFVAEMYGIAAPVAAERIAREIAAFELAEFVDYLTETYSHGMKQRIVFAASMLHDPEILVIDEPMVGLDPRSARLAKDLLRRKADGGTTIFMSTHTLSVAEEIADRVGIIDRGRLKFLGSVPELREALELHDSSLERLFLELTSTEEERFVAPRDGLQP